MLPGQQRRAGTGAKAAARPSPVVPHAPADLAIVGVIDHWDTIDPGSLELPFGETWFT